MGGRGLAALAFFSRQLSPSERKYSTLTGSSLDYGSPSDTSGFYWRAVSSLPMWTISPHVRYVQSGRTVVRPPAAAVLFISEFTTDIQHVAGRKPSVRLVAAFVWHGLRKDVKAWVDTCTACQRAKVHRHIKAPLERFSVRAEVRPRERRPGGSPASIPRLHLPLHHGGQDDPLAGGSPLSSTTSADLARAFIGTWVVRFGTPPDLSSDRARSSLRSCGVLWRRAWGLNSTVPPPTTRPTDCVNVFIGP
ncbi:hypothetical protein AAFF_G00169310 [Aldrovandia affinis]|uniref:Integrase zinc-binding domain-containing protein n=1 Tax=Aldrovandia affinis TaxID=143900 RepID=A0AAD7RLF2_9TELE|nr:hypothetical protein AAFF_G00169310 [Aldrovandia affinis]